MRSTGASNGAVNRPRARLAVSGLALALAAGGALAAPPDLAEGVAHALVVGVDRYAALPQLRGAVADATDIADTVRRLGARDVVLLTDEAADRVAILKAAEAMRARTRKDELVLVSVAGHGALEPERRRGATPDGKEAVFLLSGFSPSGPGTAQRILDAEFMRIIRGFEEKGARVLFVADSCSGGGLARGVDGRSGEVVYRAAPRYAIAQDELQPIAEPRDSGATELSFKRSLFLAAVEKDQKSPEVRPPGEAGWRGALSYALARGVEGAADADGDGGVTVKELFDYVRQVSYQMSDQRQEVVTRAAPDVDQRRERVATLTRGVSILNPKAPAGTPAPEPPQAAPQAAPPAAAPQASPQASPQAAPTATPPLATPAAPPSGKPAAPAQAGAGDATLGPRIRLASLDGQAARLSGIAPIEAGFDVVAPNQQPDLVWDPNAREAIAGGDVIARNLDAADLPAVVDRMAAVRGVKKLATQAPLTVRLSPDAKMHTRGQHVRVSVDDVGGRAFYVFNLAGDGTVQVLYPVGSDPSMFDKQSFQMEFAVREPFGSDQLVAVSAPQRLTEFDAALRRLNGRRSSVLAFKALLKDLSPGARVGSVALVTGP